MSPRDLPGKKQSEVREGKKSAIGIWIFCCPTEVMGIKKNSKDMLQTPEFKQPDMKNDQGSCAFELTHPKKVVLTQQSVVMADHMLLK